MERGPKMVIIKKGEHGAFLFKERSIFFAPAYPLEDVFDPTGAGDSFAGGFMGYLARTGDLSDENLRRAVVYGSAMGSFAVEKFSVQRLLEIDRSDIAARVADFRRLVAFEEEVRAVSDERPLDYAASGVDIDRSDDVKHRIRAVVESTFTAGARGAFGGFGGMFRIPADFQRPVLVSSADGVGTKLRVAIEADRHDTVGHDLVNHCVNDILVQGAVPLFFLDYFAVRAASCPRSWKRSCAGSPRAAARTAARSSVARRRRCPGSTRRPTTTWPASSSAAVEEDRDPRRRPRARKGTSSSDSRAAGCTPTATRSRATSSPSGCTSASHDPFPGEKATVG